MSIDASSLWVRLRTAGVVDAQEPPIDPDSAASSWPIRILLGIAGWIAALFLFGFLGLFINDLFQQAAGALVLGAMLCIAATGLFRQPRSQEFLQQFGLAVALAGQFAIWLGLFNLFGDRTALASLAAAGCEMLLVWCMPNFLHRILAGIAAGCFLFWACARWGHPYLPEAVLAALFAGLWLFESRWLARAALIEPVGIALALLLAAVSLGFMRFDLLWLWGERGMPATWAAQAANLFIGLVFVFSVHVLLRRAAISYGSPLGASVLAASALLALVCSRAPGLLPAVLLLLIGFARGYRFIFVLGLLTMVGYGAHYYFALEYNLMFKAGLLAGTGAALLGARFLMTRLTRGASHA